MSLPTAVVAAREACHGSGVSERHPEPGVPDDHDERVDETDDDVYESSLEQPPPL